MIKPSNTSREDKDLWATPIVEFSGIQSFLANFYNNEFNLFTLDACALPYNKKVNRFISPKEDMLKADWGSGEFVWVNPPYSNPLPFINRAIEMSEKNFVAMLLPSDTSTEWFAKCVEHADLIMFLTGKGARIKFEHNSGSKKTNGNVKGSVVVVFQKILTKAPQKTIYVPLNDISLLGKKSRTDLIFSSTSK